MNLQTLIDEYRELVQTVHKTHGDLDSLLGVATNGYKQYDKYATAAVLLAPWPFCLFFFLLQSTVEAVSFSLFFVLLYTTVGFLCFSSLLSLLSLLFLNQLFALFPHRLLQIATRPGCIKRQTRKGARGGTGAFGVWG